MATESNKQSDKNSSLLDKGADVKKLKGHKEIFYAYQKGSRKCRLSQDIDIEYEIEKDRIQLNETIERERHQLEEDCIMDVADDEAGARDELNRTGLARITNTANEISTQTNDIVVDCPKLCINENFF